MAARQAKWCASAVVSVMLSLPAQGSVVVGYWNFENMTLSMPPSDWAYPTPSVSPGPVGLLCSSSAGNFRLDYSSSGQSFGVGGTNLGALTDAPSGFGLRVGNGNADYIRNGGMVTFPLASMQTLHSLRMTFALWQGGFPTIRLLWSTQTDQSLGGAWHFVTNLSGANGFVLRQVDFGSLLDGAADPIVAIQFDDGGQWVSAGLDNVSFVATPIPSPGITAVGCALSLFGVLRRRRPESPA